MIKTINLKSVDEMNPLEYLDNVVIGEEEDYEFKQM